MKETTTDADALCAEAPTTDVLFQPYRLGPFSSIAADTLAMYG
jgi:hypothetical protein